ncbi:hypothetical protein OIU79_004386 [Salix purpurea]|uniref:Uncharacterized protein n=1 Tax=Salix purpurea TaxID=77065 RepID=A0A9Q0Z9G2_SALPP|nr:hypothetical protein OIU79_004386 [Salix purpurea]
MENSCSNDDSRGRNGDGDHGYVGFPIHSQVIKIRREFEKVKQPSLQQLEARGVVKCRISRQRSRSPLGLAERPISSRCIFLYLRNILANVCLSIDHLVLIQGLRQAES